MVGTDYRSFARGLERQVIEVRFGASANAQNWTIRQNQAYRAFVPGIPRRQVK